MKSQLSERENISKETKKETLFHSKTSSLYIDRKSSLNQKIDLNGANNKFSITSPQFQKVKLNIIKK